MTQIIKAITLAFLLAVPNLTFGDVVSLTAETRPNILFLMADDWSAPHAGALGDPAIRTPTFDRVAREGVLFHNAFVSSPSCTPSRLAIVSGQWHWRLRDGANLGGSLHEDETVYPELLQETGYWIGFSRKGATPSDYRFTGRDPFGPRFKTFELFLSQRKASEPFCFWYGAGEPHRPYRFGEGERSGLNLAKVKLPACLPDNETTRRDFADYLHRIQRFDADCARMLALLEQSGELENTIVVMSGDNGLPFPRCKATLYDTGTHVPLAIRWGSQVKGGRTVNDFVSLTDLGPTFLEAVGLKRPAEMTGRSLLPILASEKSGQVDPDRTSALTGMERHVYANPSRALRTADFLYIRNFEPTKWPTGERSTPQPKIDFTDGSWPRHNGAFSFNIDPSPTKQLLLEDRDDSVVNPFFRLACGPRAEEELFDLRTDPDQLHNVADDPSYAQRKDALRARLAAELQASEDPFLKQRSVIPVRPDAVSADADVSATRPNILFIALDDLNDWVGCLGGHPQSRTPNIDRLADSGVLFDNAHCAAPACNPSRTAIFTGLAPHRSGLYSNNQKMREILPDAELLPHYLSRHGYWSGGSGKMLHYFIDARSWDEYFPRRETENPFPPHIAWGKRPKNLPRGGNWQYGETDWAAFDVSDEEFGGDFLVTQWVNKQLAVEHEKPFFLACGIYRPHEPWFVPKKYFDLFPLEHVQMPLGLKEDDLADLPPTGQRIGRNRYLAHIKAQGQWRQGVQAYLASIAYADAMVGRVLDALENSPHRDNTIVVLWSDHGWHLGEKEHWQKFTGWRVCTRVPLIVRVPKGASGLVQGTATGTVCSRPVSLLSLFPTLTELAGLPAKPDNDGPSLVPLLRDTQATWPHAAATHLARPQHYAISTDQWRYIHYGDGEEELYRIPSDRFEWNNLAPSPEHSGKLIEMRALAPREMKPLTESSTQKPRKGTAK